MDVRLPNGTMIRGVPDDMSREALMAKAISGGYATESDFSSVTQRLEQPISQPQEALSPVYFEGEDIPRMVPPQVAEAEESRQNMLRVPGMADDDPIGSFKGGRAGTIAVSAMAGAELGRRSVGPDPRMQLAGAAAGGAIGAFGGSYGYDRFKNVPPHEAALTALREGELDATFGAGIPILANYAKVLGPAFIKMAGIDAEKADYLLKTASKIEAQYGIVDAASNQLVKGARTVLGVFPWIGTPFRKASARSAEAIEKNIDSQLNRVAPNATLSQLGVDMTKAAKNSYSEWKGVAGRMFDDADEYALRMDATAPSNPVVETAQNIGKRKNFPKLTEGEFTDAGGSAVTEYIDSASKIAGDRLTVEELRALETGADELWTPQLSSVDARRLMIFKEGIEKAWADISVSAGKDKAAFGNKWVDILEADELVKQNYDNAKSFYAAGMERFSTATAKKFGRVDKRIFRAGAFKSGTINEDEVARMAFNMKSPQAVSDLKAVVGPDAVRGAFRHNIETAIEKSTVRNAEGAVTSFKWDSLQKAMGLTGDAVEQKALDEVLKGTGVSAKDFYDVIELGIHMEGAPNASKFVARRATLGGKSAVFGALGAGAFIGGTSGIAATIIPALLTRYGATLLTKPETLKALLHTLDPSVKPALRRIALARLVKMSMEQDD